MKQLLSLKVSEGGYLDSKPIIRNIHFSINSGELVGLIGSNGAGKSSTIKSILGILPYFKGDIFASDFAYIPERPIFFENMTLQEHINFLYSTLNVQQQEFKFKSEELLTLFQLKAYIHQYPSTFSKGTQQKAMIILAFLKKADLYIIDEPFTGLDPRAIKYFLNLLEAERGKGAGILISTHVLDTAQNLCDRFVLIDNGQLVIQGTLPKIRNACKLSEASLLDCFDALTEAR